MDLPLFDGSLGTGPLALLLAALGIALGFEFVNGFHDTANAVATVIYTKSLTPRKAVVWSGLCNFVGVHLGGTAVAFSIVHLLPVEMLVSVGSGEGMAMVLALLIAAILWNLGTWSLGLPASSSHTLIGAILGVGLANSTLPGHTFGRGINWAKAGEVGLSLLISPVVGFCLAALLLVLLKKIVRSPDFDRPPVGDAPPPFWIRAALVTTSTGVSLAHGSNDGQKGVGLIMLILIGMLPARYALNPAQDLGEVAEAAGQLEGLLRRHAREEGPAKPASALAGQLADLRTTLEEIRGSKTLSQSERWRVRADILRADAALAKWASRPDSGLSDSEKGLVKAYRARLRQATDYAPTWVIVAVALALGTGTMVGWKRIVVTVGEKIGAAHLTYAQGLSAEVVAMGTIALADIGGLPVSTTHVLSSGIAGTMVVNKSGLQLKTVRNIALAWLLTLPVAMALAGGLFLLLRLVMA
jgi:PiT family inorganic phosphate transporter